MATKPKVQAKEPETSIGKLEAAIGKLLDEVMRSQESSITDKTKVIDRALKLESIKQKIEEPEESSGFDDD